MIQRLHWFGLLLFALVLSSPLKAQNTISTQILPTASVCSGSPIDVPFTRTGTYANAVFVVQLSNGSNYVDITTGTVSFNNSTGIYTVAATIPSNTAAGTTYRLRVTASNPAVIGTPSSTVLTVKAKPNAPTGVSPQYDCQFRPSSANADTYTPYSTIYLDNLVPNSNVAFYDSNGERVIFTSDNNVSSSSRAFKSPHVNSSPGNINYTITQSLEGCESDKKSVQLIVKPKSESGPKVTITESVTVAGPYGISGIGRVKLCQGGSTIVFGDLPITPQINYHIGYCEITNSRTIGGYLGAPCENQSPILNSTAINTNSEGRRIFRLSSIPDDPNTNCGNNYISDTYIAVDIIARPTKPAVPTSTISLCQLQIANLLSASTTDGSASLVWYGTNATGGTGASAAPQPSTTNAGTFKYYVAQKLNDCEGERAEITVEVKAASPAPTVSAVNYCQGAQASQLSAVAASGGSLNWYSSASGGTALPAGPTPQTNSIGTVNYYVSQTVSGSCESQRIALPVTVNGIPSAPTVNSPTVSVCQYTSAQQLTASGQNLKWYDQLTGGTAVVSIVPSTTAVGSKSYYVSQTINNCEGPRTVVNVTIKEGQVAPTPLDTAYFFCQGSANSIIRANLNGEANFYNWYGNAGQPTLTNFTNSGYILIATVPTDQAGTFTYWVTRTYNGCESPNSQRIKVTINAVPQAPVTNSVSVCQNSTSPVIQPAGQNLLWYTTGTGGTGSATAPTFSTTQAGQATYYVSQSVNGCEGPRAALTATVKPLPGVPTVANAGPSYCQNTQAISLTAIGTDLKWYRESSGGTSLGGNPVPDTKNAGDVTYYVSQTVDGCEGARSSVTVKVSAAPAAPAVTNAYSYCQKAVTSPLSATGTTIRWYDANGALLANAPTPSSETPNTVSYFATQTPEGCESSRAEIKVTIKSTPGAPGASAISVCQNAAGQNISASGQNLLWYTAETGGSSTPTAPTLNTAQPSQTNYYVSQTVDGCEGPRATLAVTVKSLPPAPTTVPKEICQFAKADLLTAQGQAGSELRWYFPDGILAGTTPTPPTDRGATYVYQVSQVVNSCEGPRAPLTVTILATSLPTVGKSTVELCQNAIAQPLEAAGANLKWTNPNGVVSTTAPVPPTTNPTTNPDGDVYFVTQTVSSCESAKVAIKVFVQTAPTMTILGTATTNLGLEVPLKLTFTGVGPYNYKLSNGLSGTAVKDTTISVLPERTTTYQVAEVTNKCGAGLPGNSAAVTITVLVPTIQTAALASTTTTTLCAGATLITNFTTTGAFNPGSVFKLQVAKVETDSTKISFVDVAGSQVTGGQITGNLSSSLVAGQYLVRVTATNPRIPINGTRSPTLLTVRSRATATLSGNQSVFEGQSVKLSIAFTGDGPWTFSYRDSTDSGLGEVKMVPATSINPYLLDVMPIRTTMYRLTSVDNGCGSNTQVGGAITVQVSKVLGVDDQTLADAVDVYPIPTTTTLTVRIRGLSVAQPAVLELTDLMGRMVVRHETRRETSTLTLGQYPAGVYILRIKVGDRMASRRVMKL